VEAELKDVLVRPVGAKPAAPNERIGRSEEHRPVLYARTCVDLDFALKTLACLLRGEKAAEELCDCGVTPEQDRERRIVNGPLTERETLGPEEVHD
jgi:hypothetical protein